MDRPIKIAYFIDTIFTPSAGTEKQLLYLLNGLDREKVKPHLVCSYQSEWMKTQSFDFPVTYLEIGGIISYSMCRGIRRFKKLHKNENFDIVQTFFKDGNIIGTAAARCVKCKTIISSRRNVGYWHNKMHINILRYLEKKTTDYLANSQAAADMTIEIEGASPDKFKIIYNGLKLDRFKNIDQLIRDEQRTTWNITDDNLLIGVVANLREVKKIDSMIETAAKLLPDYQNLRFVVIGEGGCRNDLQSMIDKNSIADKFNLAGQMEDIIPALAAFDIAVLPSSNESFSNSLIEYMAAGLPVVAADVGGNKEAITHNKNGLLYDINDSDGLTEAVIRLIKDNVLRQDLSSLAAKNAFELYDINSMIRNHEEYYLKLVKRQL